MSSYRTCEVCNKQYEGTNTKQKYCGYICSTNSATARATRKRLADARYWGAKVNFFERERYKIKKNYMSEKAGKEYFVDLAQDCLTGLKNGIEEYPMKSLKEIMEHYLDMVLAFTNYEEFEKNVEEEKNA